MNVNKELSTLLALAKTFLISSKNPKNVQTVDLPVAVIALWSINTTWSEYCFANTSLIREVFPLPATPVTTVSTPKGISTLTFFRLWILAFWTFRKLFGILTLSFTFIYAKRHVKTIS